MTCWVISWQIIVCYFSDFLTVWLLLWFLLEIITLTFLAKVIIFKWRIVWKTLRMKLAHFFNVRKLKSTAIISICAAICTCFHRCSLFMFNPPTINITIFFNIVGWTLVICKTIEKIEFLSNQVKSWDINLNLFYVVREVFGSENCSHPLCPIRDDL